MIAAQDLMIGDWVMYRGEPIIVYEIDEYYDRINTEPDGFNVITYVEISEVTPIPITSEILEKNGWSYNNEDAKYAAETWVGNGLMLQENGVGYRIVVVSDYDDEDTNYTPFVITDIHQLQHAMRLCGIDKEIEL